jgi:hypothetical protein
MNKREKVKILTERIEELRLRITDVEQRYIVFKTRGIMDRELNRLDKARQGLRNQLIGLTDERAMLLASTKKKKKRSK